MANVSDFDPAQDAVPDDQLLEIDRFALARAAQLQADIEEAKAKGLKLNAEAMAKRLEALYMAAQGAQVIALNPTVTPIADELLKSAGFVDAQGSGVIDPAAVPAQAEPMPAEPMPPEALPPEALPPEAMPPEAMPPEAMPPELMQADGALEGWMSGSITPEADGFSQQP
jgi:hypothetical protein